MTETPTPPLFPSRAIVQRAVDVADVRIEGDGRTVTAYATPFDRENYIEDKHGRYYERIARTAYRKSLAESANRVIVLFNHGRDLYGRAIPEMLIPIGRPVEIKADGAGLLTRTHYFPTPIGEAVLEAVRAGALRHYSHESTVLRSRQVGAREGIPVVEHLELRLHEYGPAALPAVIEGAEILAVRSTTLAERLVTLDVDALDTTTASELSAILDRVTSPATPPPSGTSPETPTGNPPPPPPPEEGTEDEERREKQEAELSRLRANLDVLRRRGHL